MIAKLSKKLSGRNALDKLGQRRSIILDRNMTGEINILVDSLFEAKDNGDYDKFKYLVAEIFLEEEGDYDYIRGLFRSDVSKEDLIREINGNNCCSVCVLLGII